MADRSMKRPLGIIDDVLVHVDKFILPADFVILDCEVDFEVPIILGKPFLATRKALVDVEAGELTFRVGDEKVVFHVCKSMRQPNSTEVCSFVDIVTAVIVDDTSAMVNVKDSLEIVLLNMDVDDDAGRVECLNVLHGMGSYSYEPRKLSLDLENCKTPPTKPSIEEPPVLELKPLPPHLRYEYLGLNFTLLVILSSCLTNVQVDATWAVLQKRKRAIGWTLADIRGISPTFCMHKIILQEDASPSLEHQRRLNEAMQEVVKKEVIKWLDVGVVYPISDSSWTSPVQCVPKKGGMIVVTNANNELIPTRTVTGWRVCMDYRKLNKVTSPTSVKGVRSFLGHAGFYQRFIKDFSKVVNPLCKLLEKEAKFVFDEKCMEAFELLKHKLTTTRIITAHNWSLPFELMCDASNVVVGAVLGQRINKIFHPVYYSSKTMNEAQRNYTVTEKELLAIVFAMEKFRPYLMGDKVIIHTDHAALRYLMTKKDSKARLMRWVLLLQEFDLEIVDHKGSENQVADHLSRLEEEGRPSDDLEINDAFPDEQLLAVSMHDMPWFADVANYLVTGIILYELSYNQRKKLNRDSLNYYWDEPYLFKICTDRVICRCVPEEEQLNILEACHSSPYGGHHGG
ncbi:uncharacterized protein [Nicotiana sylvestris]|uniref:uncharacterized protein n=1 Tax=Nicotiana sylvestris TaxID=4096 RepID=UPI00388C3995